MSVGGKIPVHSPMGDLRILTFASKKQMRRELRKHSMDDEGLIDLPQARIAWMSKGARENPTVLLIHGFASTAQVNWFNTGWADALVDAGYHVLAIDNRGHGKSQKFYDPADYGPDIFAEDAVGVLDHFGLTRVDVIGYSMGARITAWLCWQYPDRVRRAVFGGMGEHIYGGRGGYEAIAQALETDDIDGITDKGARAFRLFADRTGSDRLALAACIRPSQNQITPDKMANLKTPVLVVVGGDDDVSGRAEPLAEILPNGEAFTMPGLDHMKATGASAFKAKTFEFLSQ